MSFPATIGTRLALPVVGAPMFIVSVPDLVIAQYEAALEELAVRKPRKPASDARPAFVGSALPPVT